MGWINKLSPARPSTLWPQQPRATLQVGDRVSGQWPSREGLGVPRWPRRAMAPGLDQEQHGQQDQGRDSPPVNLWPVLGPSA